MRRLNETPPMLPSGPSSPGRRRGRAGSSATSTPRPFSRLLSLVLLTALTPWSGCSTQSGACVHPPPPPIPVRPAARPDWDQVDQWAREQRWAAVLIELDRAWRYEDRLLEEWPQ